MFILSVEGGKFLDRGNWSTHKILGAFPSREEAMQDINLNSEGYDEEDVLILTDLDSGKAERIDTSVQNIAKTVDDLRPGELGVAQ